MSWLTITTLAAHAVIREGLINISIASTITEFLQGGRHVYDIILTRPSGFKFVAVEGNALVRSGINTMVHYFGSP